ncbi:MAG TPA: DNA-binding protein [Gammaproteobacteria bacterium]|nr:DNA-binding protein [Gammaproteobacteria bacterium]
MKKRPEIGKFLDQDEMDVYKAIESANFEPVSHLTPERRAELQKIAKATINEERVKISLRLPRSDLERLKIQALRDGMPYQTLINSILHKAVTQ